MAKSPTRSWDSSTLHNDSRAWFVTKWPGKYAGAPDADILFVFEIPRPRCLCIQLVAHSTQGWEHQVLCDLASTFPAPEVLITDNTKLQHALVSAGASFQNPATAYLEKPITLMPAIRQCLLSLMELLNTPAFQTLSAISELNEGLESWRTKYNAGSCTGIT
jgi:hypothetical protein